MKASGTNQWNCGEIAASNVAHIRAKQGLKTKYKSTVNIKGGTPFFSEPEISMLINIALFRRFLSDLPARPQLLLNVPTEYALPGQPFHSIQETPDIRLED